RHVDDAGEQREARRHAAGRARRHLGDDDGAAHRGDRIRGLDLDHVAALHAVLVDGQRQLTVGDLDRRGRRRLADLEDRTLTYGDGRLAAQQQTGERLLGGGDPVLDVDLVFELPLGVLRY